MLFMPLLDGTTSDPPTLLSTMTESHRRTGRGCTDWLYKVTLEFGHTKHVGVMHWIRSFLGAVGTLMKNSGFLPWLKIAFGGAEKMLIGKKILMNVRALCFAMSKVIKQPDISSGVTWWPTQVLWWIHVTKCCHIFLCWQH